MTHRTVKSLADAAKPEDLVRGQWQRNRTSVLDEYKPYLDTRWDEGCTNAWKLREEIVPLGHRGSYGRVSAYLREKRTSPRPVAARSPTPRVVTRWILSRPETLTEIEQLRLKVVLANCPELDALTGHVRSFARMLTERQGERLPQWLDAVRQDDLPSLHTLAAGIDRDRNAVIAGLTLPWNSGVVEGHVNRIMTLAPDVRPRRLRPPAQACPARMTKPATSHRKNSYTGSSYRSISEGLRPSSSARRPSIAANHSSSSASASWKNQESKLPKASRSGSASYRSSQ
ncbi:hypothetical protein [Streptomyces cinerochromogenes]|uniref:hypothetical protein n=1 Tax=Streptomyces cinerochromogenes TaxID=66422 RepID=UPI001E36E816|nr:hypothetical protein [Streptomyces cinerochromogenes]